MIRGSAPPPDITYNQLATVASINAFAGAHSGDDTITLAGADLRFDRLRARASTTAPATGRSTPRRRRACSSTALASSA